ncbi:MAG: response regulator [Acidobacteria bacterium]|nr:response regulator [Acidobacteriota bacterium]
MTNVFGSRLKRRLWQPFVLLAGVAVVAAICFTIFLPLSPLFFWVYTLLLIGLAVAMGAVLVRQVASPVKALADLAEELSPGALQQVSKQSDEMAALTQTVTAITTEMREKEQTWIGDLERRNRAMQQLSRTLQEQAASFETALNSMDLPVCLFEGTGNTLQVNQRFSQFLGIPAEKLKPLGLLGTAAELEKFVSVPAELKKAAETIYRKPSVARDNNFAMKDGRGHMRLYCAPVFGELSSLVGIIISPAEETGAAGVEHLKTEFISTVSHELRTPLTAIKGAVGLVLGGAGGPVPGAIRDLLEIASNNTDRLIRLVNDILEIFRMESGKLKLQPSSVAVSDLVGLACSSVEKEKTAAGISLEMNLAPDLPPILVDAERVQLVLEKLISNAIKFSPAKSKVRIGAEMPPDNSRFVLLWVQDFGKGIPPEAQARIFEKFEQAEDTLTREHQGSGLGLAICRGIVEGHGGRIWVKSEPGKGSTFYLHLPVAHSPAVPKSALAADRSAAVPVSTQRHLVMVVDDDADTRSVIARILQAAGHYVVEVGSATQVSELAIRHQPEVITLDMVMPEMHGLEVLRILKNSEQTRRIPVICVSISDDLAGQAKQLGAADYLRKPVEPPALLRAIESACRTAAVGHAG